jgi:Domain of unknown function (DUF3472)
MSELIEAAPHVRVLGFNGEGTGTQLSFNRPWKLGEPLHFRLEAVQWSKDSSDYTAYLDGAFVGTVRTDGNLLESMYTFIEDVRYGADAVHLRVDMAAPVHSFRTTLKIMRSERRTFYVACGFRRGYFGIQDLNDAGEQRVLFSVWDVGSKCVVDPATRPKFNAESAAINRTAIYENILVRDGGEWRAPDHVRFTANDWRNVASGRTERGYYLSTGGNTSYAHQICGGI